MPKFIRRWNRTTDKTGNHTRLVEPTHYGDDMAGLGKLPDNQYNSMECFPRVGSHNPLSFLNCHIPSTGTIRDQKTL